MFADYVYINVPKDGRTPWSKRLGRKKRDHEKLLKIDQKTFGILNFNQFLLTDAYTF